MSKTSKAIVEEIHYYLVQIISETNGITLAETLELALSSSHVPEICKIELRDFYNKLYLYEQNKLHINDLLEHSVGHALRLYFQNFPLKYKEEHIHLTGSLSAEFIYPRLKKLIEADSNGVYHKKLKEVYGDDVELPSCIQDVDELIRLRPTEEFDRYLEILQPAKFVLVDKKAHEDLSLIHI